MKTKFILKIEKAFNILTHFFRQGTQIKIYFLNLFTI